MGPEPIGWLRTLNEERGEERAKERAKERA
jgi:hypothetical protein